MSMNRDECIAEVMRDFDFDKVHAAMVAVGWRWSRPGMARDPDVPSRDELVTTARELLEMAWNEKDTVRTGGFCASFDPGDEETAEHPNLGLCFVMARADVDVRP